ncbi:hypothetical protein R1sor_007897 [Riccia sorocarpa]|uniref:PIFI-like Ig-like domain-containing protein n=1 Tax=Riccia sorocarpa TaxID=122646 RepID=A0ABD3HTH5_9MARC
MASAFTVPARCANSAAVLPAACRAPSSSSRTQCNLRSFGTKRFRQATALPDGQRRRERSAAGKVYATALVIKGAETYQLPTWAEFEMGTRPVYWETENGLPPASGQGIAIYFNPNASQLVPRTEYGIGFNGGFNQPIMCGGEPRIMTRRERGPKCEPFYIIKINVPEYALTLEFSFTDGLEWDGPYKLKFEVPDKWKNQPISFFNEGLADILTKEGACESAIYPEPTFIQDRCSFPANLTIEGGDRCELDLVPGCTDPQNPFYNPLANVEDGSCPYISDSDTE